MRSLQRIVSIVIVVVGAASLAFGTVLLWTQGHLFDTQEVVKTTDEVLTSPDVQTLMATQITDRVMTYIGDETFRPQVASIVGDAVTDPELQTLVNDGVRQAHRALVVGDVERITLNLDALSREVRADVVAAVPELDARLPPADDVLTFELITRSDLPAAWRLADRFHDAAALLLSLGVVLVCLALVIGPARWIRLIVGGLTFAAFGALSIAALAAATGVVEDRITDPIVTAATVDIFDAFFVSLERQSILMIVGGLLAVMLGVAIRLMRPEYARQTRGPTPWR
jgi:hypothetical protein